MLPLGGARGFAGHAQRFDTVLLPRFATQMLAGRMQPPVDLPARSNRRDARCVIQRLKLAIAQRIRQMSNDELRVGQGSLYPALHKLEQNGWIEAKWGESENNRRAKYYALTRAGRKALEKETAQWGRLSAAISLVVKPI